LFITSLKLTNYRNFEQQTFRFDKERTSVCADNASGKSNLLEAIYFLAIGKSGRGARDRDVVRWGESFFRIEATVQTSETVSLAIAYDAALGKKRALRDDVPLPRLSDLIGALNAVLFSPEDVDLVLRDPPQRRRLLDILVSQSSASYLSDLEVYRRVLAQRNRLLKERPAGVRDQLPAWNTQLSDLGARIIRQRLETLQRMLQPVGDFYRQIGQSSEQLEPIYRSPVGSEDGARAAEVLRSALETRTEEELRLGFTLAGPHRDNLVFQLDGHPAHRFASKGQMKSVLLSWKLAEATYLEQETGHKPVMLLDDIFSELDRGRARSLLEMIRSFGQVVLTTARDPDLDFGAQGFSRVEL
jgi:DNA replication and repair protein RecF